MKLYGVPLSPFVRKVVFLMAELGLDCERIDVAPRSDDADFRRVSPAGRIPGFADGEFEIADSAAICRYLVTRELSGLMGGPSPQRQARIVQWETFADDDLSPALFTPLLERVVKPVRLGQPTDESAVHEAVDGALPAVYGRLDAALARRGPWLIGESFSYADIAVGAHMATAALADVLPEAADHPAIDAWHGRLSERAGYRAMMDEAGAYIARD